MITSLRFVAFSSLLFAAVGCSSTSGDELLTSFEPPVRLRFESATPAEVLDATTREVLGRTGEDLTLPRSSSSRQLLLQAAGYEDLQHAITPDHDQTLKVELVRKSGKKKRVERVETKKSGVDLTPLRPEFGKDKKR